MSHLWGLVSIKSLFLNNYIKTFIVKDVKCCIDGLIEMKELKISEFLSIA